MLFSEIHLAEQVSDAQPQMRFVDSGLEFWIFSELLQDLLHLLGFPELGGFFFEVDFHALLDDLVSVRRFWNSDDGMGPLWLHRQRLQQAPPASCCDVLAALRAHLVQAGLHDLQVVYALLVDPVLGDALLVQALAELPAVFHAIYIANKRF